MPSNVANALTAYNQAVARLGKTGLNARPKSDDGDFAGLVQQAAKTATDALKQGEVVTGQAMTGSADMTSIITAVTNAELTLQTVVAVRDRVIQAYQDIMRMPI